ncbi:MAG: AAA family ATPase [Armatimonadetes bacterium]|nr:AAA family ATPase [Armatimonadota bacterium]
MSLYLDHFGLRASPFSTSPDPEFAYQTQEHQLAVTKVAYSVDEQRGLFLLTGPIGSGKTTVAELLVSTWEEHPDRYAVAHLTDPSAATPAAFLRVVLASFGQATARNLQDLKDALRLFLVECYQSRKIAVLLLDEAQTISRANLDLLQMLSNEATAKAKLLQIVLFAQDNFQNKLTQKPALRSRITGGAHLDPLTIEDSLEMLRFRASVAGGDFDAMFLPEVHKPLYNAAAGIPRELCVLCDAALVNAFALRRPAVDMACLAAAADDLRFKGFRLQPVE